MSVIGKLFKLIFKGVGCLFMLVGFAVVALIVSAFFMLNTVWEENNSLPPTSFMPEKFSLTINIDDIHSSLDYANLFNPFMLTNKGYTVDDVLMALDEAKNDKRVEALYAKIGSTFIDMTSIQQIRERIDDLNDVGKNTITYSESIGLDGMGTAEYYLASSFNEIWVQPTGMVNFVGLSLTEPFFKNLLGKVGVGADFYSRHEYKGAIESATAEKMSMPVKENLTNMLSGMYDEILSSVALSRGMTVAKVGEIVDNAPYSAIKSLELGLIDRTVYVDSFNELTKRGKTVTFSAYINEIKARKLLKKEKSLAEPRLAVINIGGMIMSGTSYDNPFNEFGYLSTSDDIIAALDIIAKDKRVKALLLKINSGGGSYVASDAIWHAILRFKKVTGMPVVALLGDTAASGAYFIAIAADKIVANPFTITGSIGVFGGKPFISELLTKIGVTVDDIKMGDNADMMSIARPFTDKQRKNFEDSLDEVYKDFSTKVAEARAFSDMELDLVARGRIFNGIQADKLGLVDEVGGYNEAIAIISEAAGINRDAFVIDSYPRPLTFLEMMQQMIESGSVALPLAEGKAFVQTLEVLSNDSVLLSPSYKVR